MLRVTHGIGRRIAAATLPLLLLTACAGEQTTKVAASDVVGDWQGPGKDRITLSKDHTFVSHDLGEKSDHCPAGRNSGTWGFFVDDGASGAAVSRKAASGDRIGLSFASDDSQEFSCFVDLAVVDGGKTLCATDDPDDPCGLDVRFTRRK
ncbi:hypothetical protein ACF1GT_25280 [Streptomyces sp. NPDC014636]|uniref:hypothetical protein n=1 Tax=Streptomyces sp. NPDC014636 TaxID=3364876 RepID=UPI0036F651FA